MDAALDFAAAGQFERNVIEYLTEHPDTRQVWAHEDKPVTYRTNRAGRRVVDHDPRCIQSIYSFDDLRIST